MKSKILVLMLAMMFVLVGMSNAAEDSTSLGASAGTAAREVKSTADESYATGMLKVGEASRKMETDTRETLKVLQQQWDVLAGQLQAKTRQIQKQLDQQWRDFQKSFNKPQQQ